MLARVTPYLADKNGSRDLLLQRSLSLHCGLILQIENETKASHLNATEGVLLARVTPATERKGS